MKQLLELLLDYVDIYYNINTIDNDMIFFNNYNITDERFYCIICQNITPITQVINVIFHLEEMILVDYIIHYCLHTIRLNSIKFSQKY